MCYGPSPIMQRPWVRHALALAVAAMGLIDLASALLSHPSNRLLAMRHLVPTDVLDTSRTFTLVAGALLLVTASGLSRGKRRAFTAALLLCAISVPVNLLKAFDFEEATVSAGLMFFLGVNADAFRVRSREWDVRALRSRAMWAFLGFVVYAVVGCWVLEGIYGQDPSLRHAADEALYRVLGIGDPALTIPHVLPHASLRVVRWFLGSLPLIGLLLVLGLAVAALRPARHRARHRREEERVAELIRGWGDNSVCAFALDPEADYFFSPNGRAVIAYRFQSDTLLVIGDPIGPPEEIPPLLSAFAEFCREHDWRFAFFQARPERLPEYRRLGWRAIHIGEDPVLWSQSFTLEGAPMGVVRRAVRKLEREGLEARFFLPGENPFDPAHDPDGFLEPMKAISAEWLASRQGGEKGFCMGRFDPERLGEHALAIARNTHTGRVEAFCTFAPIPVRRGWMLDLMRRRADAPTGVMEFLVARMMQRLAERGDSMLSLGLSALVSVPEPGGVGPASVPHEPENAQAADARAFLMDALARYYDFKGLFQWKKKFAPQFEDRFLVFADPLALPRVASALIRIQTPAGLWSYLRRPSRA